MAKAFFANLFFHLLDTAKVDPRGTLRFRRRHARSDVFLCQHVEVGMNLLVQVYLHTTSGKEISQETSGFHQERHAKDFSYRHSIGIIIIYI